MNVLVVDDEPAVLEVCRDILEEEGWLVATAHDGSAALEAARQAPPDAVVLDVAMPGMDGFAVAEALLADETTAAPQIIFLTARANFDDQLRGYEAGGIEYITKPFSAEHFVTLLRRAMARKQEGSSIPATERQARIGALRILLGIS